MLAGSMLTGIASPALLAARTASLVAPVTSVAANKGSNKKRKKNAEKLEALRKEKYGAYIQAQKARIELVANEQRQILMRENPTMTECAEITVGLKRNLWERNPYDSDFLDVRVGMGYEPLCVSVKARQDSATFQIDEDEVSELTNQIIEETRIVDNVPARVSLLKNSVIGVVGQRNKEQSLIRNILVSLCTSHCYEDVRIAGVFDENEYDIWSPIRWLPHIWNDDKQYRLLSFDKSGAHQICEFLGEVIAERQKAHSCPECRTEAGHWPASASGAAEKETAWSRSPASGSRRRAGGSRRNSVPRVPRPYPRPARAWRSRSGSGQSARRRGSRRG